MTRQGIQILIGLFGLVAGAAITLAATPATTPSTTDRAAIETVVHDYILAHPEILPQAMERLQSRETAKVIRDNRALIETPYGNAWDGAKNPDVVLVEFFDYACGYCRASLPVIDRLLKEDPKIRIVYREMPVLGPDSEAAAHVSLAVAKAGPYGQFHRALYAAGSPAKQVVARIAMAFKVDPSTAESEATRTEIANNMALQNELRITGTPSWVVGDRLLTGAVGYDALKAAIKEARSRG